MSAPSSGFRNGRTRPRRPKTLGGDRFPVKPIFPGPSPARNIPGYGSRAQKLLARSVGAPENFGHIRRPVQKLRHFFSVTDAQTDRRTDGQTHRHFRMTPVPLRGEKIFFLPICVGKLIHNCKLREISTISLREASLASLHFVKDKIPCIGRTLAKSL